MTDDQQMRDKLVYSLETFNKWVDLIRNGEAEITNMSIQRVPKGEMSPEEFAERSKELIAKVFKLEREMCAKLCEDLSKDMTPIAEQAAKSCATLIRARTA